MKVLHDNNNDGGTDCDCVNNNECDHVNNKDNANSIQAIIATIIEVRINGIFYIQARKKNNILYILIPKKKDSFLMPNKRIYILHKINRYMAIKFYYDNAVIICEVNYDNMVTTTKKCHWRLAMVVAKYRQSSTRQGTFCYEWTNCWIKLSLYKRGAHTTGSAIIEPKASIPCFVRKWEYRDPSAKSLP